jgi:DNA-directed RNA polymerase I subunit RPA2
MKTDKSLSSSSKQRDSLSKEAAATATTRNDKTVINTCPSFRNSHLPSRDHVNDLRKLTAPHVDSFDYFLTTGLPAAIRAIEPCELELVNPKKLRINPDEDAPPIDTSEMTTVEMWIENVKIGRPSKPDGLGFNNKLLPREARERRVHYSGTIYGTFCYSIIQRRNGARLPGRPVKVERQFGEMPIMVSSQACHLQGMSPAQLVKHNEEVSSFQSVSVVCILLTMLLLLLMLTICMYHHDNTFASV